MKCKGCGAAYDSQLECCPYCGLDNARLRKERAKLQEKRANYEKKKKKVLTEAADEIRLRKLSRVMWIMLGLLGTLLAAIFLFFFLREEMDIRFHQTDPAYLQEMKEAGHWKAMANYLYDTDADYKEFGEYWQLAIFSDEAEDLWRYRDEYRTLDREKYRTAFTGGEMDPYDRDYCLHHFRYLVDRILWSCWDILHEREEYNGQSWKAEIYGPMTAEADDMLRKKEEEAIATWKVLFGMNEEEIAEWLERSYLDTETIEAYTEKVRERWLYEE